MYTYNIIRKHTTGNVLLTRDTRQRISLVEVNLLLLFLSTTNFNFSILCMLIEQLRQLYYRSRVPYYVLRKIRTKLLSCFYQFLSNLKYCYYNITFNLQIKGSKKLYFQYHQYRTVSKYIYQGAAIVKSRLFNQVFPRTISTPKPYY